jgi:superfamily II DNA or RNA helicase
LFIPRKHQIECVETLMNHDGRFSVGEACVASGKSGMLGILATRYSERGRVLIVAHNKELVVQNADAARLLGLHPGICSASISTNAFCRVTIGTIGTVVNRLRLFRDVVAILVDEVHRVPPAKSSQYRRLFEMLPHAKVHGLTATPFRADGTGDLEKTFGPVVYKYGFLQALHEGYVKPLVPVDAGEDETIDVDGIKIVAGDFDMDEMAPRAMKLAPSHARTIVHVMKELNRKRVLVFCCNTAHVDRMEKELHAIGASVVGVHSKSVTGKRDKAVAAFRLGVVQILVSCNMFGTGFNVEDIDYLVFCRALLSSLFYAQGLGRGARITPHAENCLVSDFGGNIQRHGALDAIVASPGKVLECNERDYKGIALGCGAEWQTWEHGRTCPKCERLHTSAPKCKSCDKRFDPFYCGMKCPHCGTQQSALKQCAACEKPYAAFLHPICPFCDFDNSSTQSPGKDLKTRGGEQEVVSVRKIIESEPWQLITSPPVKQDSGGWLLTTKFTTAIWKYETLPGDPHSVYLKRSTNGRYMAVGLYDTQGRVHQP